MGTVVIDGNNYDILGTLDGANIFLRGSGLFKPAWAASTVTNDMRAGALVDAARYFETLPWRAVVSYANEPKIVEASYMLAGVLVANPQALGGAGGATAQTGGVREVQDTTRRVSFFRASSAQSAQTSGVGALPRDIRRILQPYLDRWASSSAARPTATGTDGESEFTDDKQFLLANNVDNSHH